MSINAQGNFAAAGAVGSQAAATALFKIEFSATGEVRDKDGNLISSEPITSSKIVTAAELEAMGIDPSDYPQEK